MYDNCGSNINYIITHDEYIQQWLKNARHNEAVIVTTHNCTDHTRSDIIKICVTDNNSGGCIMNHSRGDKSIHNKYI